MLDTYRTVLTRPGTLRFSLAGLVGRMPISMEGIGIVLLVSGLTGSYGRAGSLAAAAVLANAICALPHGRLVDRLGQRRVLAPAISIWAATMTLLVVGVERDWPAWLNFAIAAAAGATLPQVGSCVRARWTHAAPAGVLHTAFAWESVLDEVVFIVGPILVTLLSTTLHPAAGLLCAVALGLAGTWWLTAQRATEPPVHPAVRADGGRVGMPWRALTPVLVVLTFMGVVFGSTEVAVVGFTAAHGHKDLAGLVLAVWALGSLLAGLVVGAVHWRSGPQWRVRSGAVAITAAFAPLPWSHSLTLTTVLLFVGGFSISPLLIGSMTLVERITPTARLTEGMGLMTSGMAAGVALGAAVAGHVIDAYDAETSFLVPLLAGAAAALTSALVHDSPVRPQGRVSQP